MTGFNRRRRLPSGKRWHALWISVSLREHASFSLSTESVLQFKRELYFTAWFALMSILALCTCGRN